MDEAVFAVVESGSEYRLAWGRISVPVRRIWRTGLALSQDDARHMPGLVHLYCGDDHVATGLIVSHEIAVDEHRFHFKRLTLCEAGPARDWAPDPRADPEPEAASISPRPLALRRLWG